MKGAFGMNLRSRCGDRRLPVRVRRAVRLLGAVLVLLPAWMAEAQTLVRGPYLQSGTSSSVIVKWRTDEATDSVVRYGPDPDSLTLSASDPDSTTEHAVQLTGLSADAKYFYSVGTSSITLGGGDRDHFVVTAPVPGTAKPTRIWVIGDSGKADKNAEAVRDAFLNFTGSRAPDLWIMLGDNAYKDGTDAEYQAAVFGTYPQVLPKTVLWPTLGNHDGRNADSTTESGPYYDIFSLPRNGEAGGVASGTEAYYSFDYGNMHFICLDSHDTDRSADGNMMTWLAADLATQTTRNGSSRSGTTPPIPRVITTPTEKARRSACGRTPGPFSSGTASIWCSPGIVTPTSVPILSIAITGIPAPSPTP